MLNPGTFTQLLQSILGSSRNLLRSVNVRKAVRYTLGCLLAVFLTLGVLDLKFSHLTNHLLVSEGDPGFVAWVLERVRQNLFTDPIHLFDGRIYYPTAWTLAFSEHLVGLQPLYIPLYLVTGNVILSLNLLIIFSTVLSLIGMYLYLRGRWVSPWASFLGAAVFAFAIPRLAQFGHVQLLNLFYMPLALLALERFLLSGKTRWGVSFFLLASLQGLSSYYLAYPFLIYCFIHTAIVVAADKPGRKRLLQLAVCYAAIGIVIALFSWPYLIVARAYEHRGSLSELVNMSADLPNSYLSVPVQNKVWGALLLRFQVGGMVHEKWLFMGATCYGFFSLGLLGYISRRSFWDRYRVAWLIGAIALLILSFGPILIVNNKPTGIFLPYMWLYHVIPGFKALGVPARMGLVLVFPMACIAAVALDAVLSWLRRRTHRSLGPILAALVVAAAMWESRTTFAVVPFPKQLSVPNCYSWIADHRLQGGILDWPGPPLGFGPIEYMHFHLSGGSRTVHGYSGFAPLSYRDIMARWEKPRVESLRYYKALGISTIVYHKHRVPDGNHRAKIDALATDGYLKRLYSDEKTDVFGVNVAADVTTDVSLVPMLPDYADTLFARQFAVQLKVRPEGAIWLSPLKRDGVSGKARYSPDSSPAGRAGAEAMSSSAAEESLKLLPRAASNGDIALFHFETARKLIAEHSKDLKVEWTFFDEFSLRPVSFTIQKPPAQKREFLFDYATTDLRVTTSHNSSDAAMMLDGNLETAWTSKQIMEAGMYLDIETMPERPLSGFCLWLGGGGGYISYPTTFRILSEAEDGRFKDVLYRFNLVGYPERARENRIEVFFDRPLSGKVRMEIIRPPPEGDWFWSISDLQPYYPK